MTDVPLLLVSAHVEGVVRVLTVPDGTEVHRLTGRHLRGRSGWLPG